MVQPIEKGVFTAGSVASKLVRTVVGNDEVCRLSKKALELVDPLGILIFMKLESQSFLYHHNYWKKIILQNIQKSQWFK